MDAGADLLQPGLAALGGRDLEPFVAQQDAQRIEDAGLVVDDEDRGLLTSCSVLRHHLGGQKDGERGAGARAPNPPGPARGAPRPRAARSRARARCRPDGRTRTGRKPVPDLLGDARARRPGPGAAPRAPGWCRGASRPPDTEATLTVTLTGPRAACTAFSTRFVTTRCSRSSSPSSTVRPPSIDDAPRRAGTPGWARISRTTAASRPRAGRAGTNCVARTRAKSRNSLSSRLSRSLSRTISAGEEALVLVGVARRGRAARPSSGSRPAGSGSRAPATRSAPPPPPAARPAPAAPALPSGRRCR